MSEYIPEDETTTIHVTPKLCAECGKNIDSRLSFVWNPEICFTQLKEGESVHLECYIDRCVRISIQNKLDSSTDLPTKKISK